MKFVADPRLPISFTVPLNTNIAVFRQLFNHLFQTHLLLPFHRYLAFLWNTYEDFGCRLLLTARRYRAAGYDLHIYDIKEGKLKRVTSPERMKRFDPPEDYEKFVKKRKQILEEEQKRQKMILAQQIEELKKELEEKKKKEAVKIEDLYPGVSGYEWSKPAAQLIFQYRGDLYRYLPETDEIRRLTMTDEAESIISYTPDGSGYYYAKEERVFLVKFDSAYIRQIDHQLNEDNKYKIAQTRISPDGKRLAAVLNNEAGFRQPVIFDLKTKKKTSVLKGKFESYPILDFSRDSCYMYIVSDKESPAWRTVYRVTLDSGVVFVKHPDRRGECLNRQPPQGLGKYLLYQTGNFPIQEPRRRYHPGHDLQAGGLETGG